MRIVTPFLVILLSLLPSTLSAQKKHALLVGISNYHAVDKYSEWNDIHGVNDIRLIEPTLKEQGFSIVTLQEEQATYQNIINQLTLLTESVRKGDIIYLHFSCHGQPYEDLDGDESDGWDESLVPVNAPVAFEKGKYEGDKHLIDDKLNQFSETIRTKIGKNGYLYLVIDACHAGNSYRGNDEEITRGTTRGFTPSGKYFRPKKKIKTHYWIGASNSQAPITCLQACQSTQTNTEISRGGYLYGPLSYYINQVLTHTPLGKKTDWVFQVQQLMRKDIDVNKQDMVIEQSK